MAEQTDPPCHWCGNVLLSNPLGDSHRSCRQCHEVFYCNRQCERTAFRYHNAICSNSTGAAPPQSFTVCSSARQCRGARRNATPTHVKPPGKDLAPEDPASPESGDRTLKYSNRHGTSLTFSQIMHPGSVPWTSSTISRISRVYHCRREHW